MPDDPRRIRFVADRGDARARLDRVLVRRVGSVSGLSRARAQRWIAEGAVFVDGARAARASTTVREGAVVEVALPDTARLKQRPEPEPLALDVLYEDEHLLAVNKPAGQVVHPSYANSSGTLLNAVLWHVRDRAGVRPGIVSRLDRQTSGVLLVALSARVHAALQRDASAGRLRKEYLAVVRGTPARPRGEIALPLARDPRDRRRTVVDGGGKASLTRYETIAGGAGLSVLRCELATGRTHQIRAHLAARGWPIVGDPLYGGTAETAEPVEAAHAPGRQALHAWRVTAPHPWDRRAFTVEAPLPADLRDLVDQIERASPPRDDARPDARTSGP